MNDPRAAAGTGAESVGRYVLYPPIARGGMATVHAARLVGAEGFSRLVAAKRLHPHFSEDPDFLAMFHDEARIASRIHHPNVVPVLDVVLTERDTVLVQEYVHGVPLSYLMKVANTTGAPVPVPIVVAIIAGVLAGLHAAHEARDELEVPLGIIHRDVSPQNVMVSVDGVPRLLDFGIAKARTSAHHTREGIFKGKLAYVAPEQIRLEPLTRNVDIYAVGVVMWELLANRRFNDGKDDAEFVASLVDDSIPTIEEACLPQRRTMTDEQWTKLRALSAVVARARALSTQQRFASAVEMLTALLAAHDPAPPHDVAEFVRSSAGQYIDRQQRELAVNEENWRSLSNVSTANNTTASWRPSIEATLTQSSASGASSRRGPSSLSPLVGLGNLVPSRRGWPAVIGASGTIIVAMLFGVLVGTNHRGTTDAAAAALPAESTPSPQVEAASISATRPPATTTAATAATGASSASSPSTPSPTAFAPQVTVASVRAQPPRFVAMPRAPAPPVVPASTPMAAPSATPGDCNPPFYFDGAKKVFKRSCL